MRGTTHKRIFLSSAWVESRLGTGKGRGSGEGPFSHIFVYAIAPLLFAQFLCLFCVMSMHYQLLCVCVCFHAHFVLGVAGLRFHVRLKS